MALSLPKYIAQFIVKRGNKQCKDYEECKKSDSSNLPKFLRPSKPGGYKPYLLLTIGLGLPLIVANTIGTLVKAEKKERPPFVQYPYLRIRTKKFPWGDGNKSLFHNPERNALPDGYEEESS